ncbi:hypothetical protein HPB48_017737 [Haemaphysalis longicornis]|uniref:Uncharacterized protein n=1 Tax=Haemaphysalis longicornis TaxID=44386 RepID=A0A9J6G1S8_HAELO|nr:hypothetical protein HPB48_017737 [Haemaphysalis longicornis]
MRPQSAKTPAPESHRRARELWPSGCFMECAPTYEEDSKQIVRAHSTHKRLPWGTTAVAPPVSIPGQAHLCALRVVVEETGLALNLGAGRVSRSAGGCRSPKAPYKCTLSNQTEDASPAVVRQLYSLEVHDISCHRLLANLSAERPHSGSRAVPAGLNYVLVLYAVNEMGRSQPVLLRAEAADRYWDGARHGTRAFRAAFTARDDGSCKRAVGLLFVVPPLPLSLQQDSSEWGGSGGCEQGSSLVVIMVAVTFAAVFFLFLLVIVARCRNKH